jgi:hypothetical protein
MDIEAARQQAHDVDDSVLLTELYNFQTEPWPDDLGQAAGMCSLELAHDGFHAPWDPRECPWAG